MEDYKNIDEEDIKQYTFDAKKEIFDRELTLDPELFTPKEFDLSKAYYEMDIIQNDLIKFYLKQDQRFRKAFFTNYTNHFFQFLKDKARLKEPYHLATMGTIRGGKSYSMITLICFSNALNGRKTTINYINGNTIEFLMKIANMPSEESGNSTFLNDEDKQAVFGYGSMAKKVKLQDVQSIIAMNNISTITINPRRFTNQDAFYGLRAMGRCKTTKTCRFMLYNLQESSNVHKPLGMVYIPIFPEVVPYWRELERDYLIKKKIWIEAEKRGEGDINVKLQKKEADRFFQDPNYLLLKNKRQRIQYITLKLGSEWSIKEIESIEVITNLLKEGRIQIDE